MGKLSVRLKPRPAVFPHELVTTAPTLEAVLEMCTRLPFSRTTVVKARAYLPFLLEGKLYTEGNSNVYLDVFVVGSDPYEYYSYCQDIEVQHPGTKSCGGWLKSVARLLICWVAEELKMQGCGLGFDDHFRVSEEALWQPAPGVPVAAPAPVPVAASDVHVAASDVHVAAPAPVPVAASDVQVAAPSPVPVAAPNVEVAAPAPVPVAAHIPTTRGAVAPTPQRLTIPPYTVQMARTCTLIPPLQQFLARGGHINGRKRGRVDYSRHESPAVFEQIRFFFTRTEEGRTHMREHAQLDPEGFEVDHVIADSIGGPSHLFNAYLMPASLNSHFGDTWTAEKRTYVGEHAVKAARTAMQWGRLRVDWHAMSS
jgi:hypothetical protein